MSSSVLSFSDQDLFSEEGTLFGHYTFADEDVVRGLIDQVREHVRWHGTSIAHGARHGAIRQITAVRLGGGYQSLSFVDNHGRELLAASATDAREDLGVGVRLIVAVGVPTYIVERAVSDGTFVFVWDGAWQLL